VSLKKNNNQKIMKEETKEKKPKILKSILAGLSSMLIMIPVVFLVVYFARSHSSLPENSMNKLLITDQGFQEGILNETNLVGEENRSEKIIAGIVQGEQITASDQQAQKAGLTLASENYKASGVSLGGEIILNSNSENEPLEISDIKSESYITAKSNASSGNSAEEIKLVVSWKTNKLAMSEIDYSKNNGQEPKAIKEQSFGFNHAVVLTQIDPRTSYVYQVKGKDHWGNEVASDYYGIFTTSKPVSVFDLISKQINDIFGWAIKK
jgi:hypothetical protein